jgi:tetratricopeptide (TPR) repeat protein
LEEAAKQFITDATAALQSLHGEDKHIVAEALQRLGDLEFDTWKTAGDAYYQANDYGGAERCWAKCKPHPTEYWEVGFKNRGEGVRALEWLLENEVPDQIVVEYWRKAGNGAVRLSNTSLVERLAQVLMGENLFAEAVGVLLDSGPVPLDSGPIPKVANALKAWLRQLEDAKSVDTEEYEQCLVETVKRYLEHGSYEEAASLAQGCAPSSQDATWRVARAICGVLASSSRIPDLKNPHRQLAQFIWNAVQSLRDRRTVVVEVVGSALERTGDLEVSREFYKAVEEWGTSEKRKKFAQARLFAIDRKQGQRQLDEIRREAKNQGFEIENLPDYPDVGELQPSIEIDTTMASPKIDQRTETMAVLNFLGITILADAQAEVVRLMKDLDKPGGFGVFIDASDPSKSTTTGRGIQTTKVAGQIEFGLPNQITVTARRRPFETEVTIKGNKGSLKLYVMNLAG